MENSLEGALPICPNDCFKKRINFSSGFYDLLHRIEVLSDYRWDGKEVKKSISFV